MIQKFWRLFIGDPLATKAISHERLTNAQGLAIFSSDALSSTAYATEEVLLSLSAGGVAYLYTSLPIALVIVLLIAIVTLSYQQVVRAYPQGGGVYNVAKENLGENYALLGAASLIVDYILTAAVSVAAGVAAMTSVYPALLPHRVGIGILFLLFLTWMNLRGVKESGKIFTLPTYLFIGIFTGMIVFGIWQFVSGNMTYAVLETKAGAEINLFVIVLLIKSFASGCTAMTGIEATSNGVQAFHAPEADNAAKTMTRMAIVLSFIFVGITLLANWIGITPSHDETVVSQIARALFGNGVIYVAIQAATIMILMLAANTPFADLPRVLSQLAKDEYVPLQYLNLGSRLVFANGIITLALCASILLYIFGGVVHALIPLYAVGVFLSFSLSQAGMVVHWLKEKDRNWGKIVLNGFGCLVTTIVFLIVLISKFTHGAWILVPTLIATILTMKKIHNYYQQVNAKLAIKDGNGLAHPKKTIVILVSRMTRVALHAVNVAKPFDPEHLLAVHVAVDPEEAERLKKDWEKFVPDVPIDVLVSEYRDLINPVLTYLKTLDTKYLDDEITVVIPEIVPDRWWGFWLHNRTAALLRKSIIKDPDINAQVLEAPLKIGSRF